MSRGCKGGGGELLGMKSFAEKEGRGGEASIRRQGCKQDRERGGLQSSPHTTA